MAEQAANNDPDIILLLQYSFVRVVRKRSAKPFTPVRFRQGILHKSYEGLEMLTLVVGGLFNRYAIVGVHTSGKLTNPRYFMRWNKALGMAGFFAKDSIPHRIYVWNSLHESWFHVMTVNP